MKLLTHSALVLERNVPRVTLKWSGKIVWPLTDVGKYTGYVLIAVPVRRWDITDSQWVWGLARASPKLLLLWSLPGQYYQKLVQRRDISIQRTCWWMTQCQYCTLNWWIDELGRLQGMIMSLPGKYVAAECISGQQACRGSVMIRTWHPCGQCCGSCTHFHEYNISYWV